MNVKVGKKNKKNILRYKMSQGMGTRSPEVKKKTTTKKTCKLVLKFNPTQKVLGGIGIMLLWIPLKK